MWTRVRMRMHPSSVSMLDRAHARIRSIGAFASERGADVDLTKHVGVFFRFRLFPVQEVPRYRARLTRVIRVGWQSR